MDRIILHCDLNSFYASVELRSRPDLQNVPVAVCGDPTSRHGIILAKNEPAKKFGVQTAETIWQAKKKCPELVLLPPHHKLYRQVSKEVNTIYEQYTDLVEPFGIDESWLDVTHTLHLFGGDAKALADHLRRGCETKGYPMPRVLLEPGRSIVANAGLTLYRVGGVKTIAGYRSYVTVNGGMTDNPRYALYQAPYTVLPASRMGETRDFLCTVAGRCCESGDLIQENVSLPQPARDDLLAVLTTGAYNFTMASNYNRLCRPALVMVRGGKARLAVRRQTFADLVACDL